MSGLTRVSTQPQRVFATGLEVITMGGAAPAAASGGFLSADETPYIALQSAGNEVFVPDFQHSIPTGVAKESKVIRTLGDSALMLRTGHKWRISWLHDIWAAMGLEAVQGGTDSGDYHATFQLRWSF